MMPCEREGHAWAPLGLVYEVADYPMAGTGARAMTYYDRFFCARCLTYRDVNPRVIGNSYGKPLAGSAPAGRVHR